MLARAQVLVPVRVLVQVLVPVRVLVQAPEPERVRAWVQAPALERQPELRGERSQLEVGA